MTMKLRKQNGFVLQVVWRTVIWVSLLAIAIIPSSALSSINSPRNRNNNNINDDDDQLSSPPITTPSSFFDYRTTRVIETSKTLDASRFHFQILFVDADNMMGRIAEGLCARIAEYNDALFMLFPSSATIMTTPTTTTSSTSSTSTVSSRAHRSPMIEDATAPINAVNICKQLNLCSHTSNQIGTKFDLSNDVLQQYDLILCMNESIRLRILQEAMMTMKNDDEYDCYGDLAFKCRSLSEFVNLDFIQNFGSEIAKRKEEDRASASASDDANNRHHNDDVNHRRKILLEKMLEPDLFDRAAPLVDVLQSTLDLETIFHQASVPDAAETTTQHNNIYHQQVPPPPPPPPVLLWDDETNTVIPNAESWTVCEAALILSAVGVTRFCLDTIQYQMEDTFDDILSRIVVDQSAVQSLQWSTVEERLSRCNDAVSGYFSPQERLQRYQRHCQRLMKANY
jgi:hypothetical protein